MRLPAKTASAILRVARKLEPLLLEEDQLTERLSEIRGMEKPLLEKLVDAMRRDAIEEFSFNGYIFEVWQGSVTKEWNVGIRTRRESRLRKRREYQ